MAEEEPDDAAPPAVPEDRERNKAEDRTAAKRSFIQLPVVKASKVAYAYQRFTLRIL
jgi:hypothetical protein